MAGSEQPVVLALPGPVYCYRYDGDFRINGHPIIVQQEGGQGRGTGWAVWDGAAAAAKYLEAAATEILAALQPRSILELGSGTGLAGLAAAAALQLPTLLTDLPQVLPSLQRNIEANPALRQLVSCTALDWYQPTVPAAGSTPADSLDSSGAAPAAAAPAAASASGGGGRLVLAADCVWLEELVQPFVETLELVASHPTDRVLLSYQSRSTKVDSLLFGLLRRRFAVQPVPPLQAEPDRGPIDVYWLLPIPQPDMDV